ncbi:MAG: DEAD/DEAH box helicase family protein, partial [Bacilli bacterium]
MGLFLENLKVSLHKGFIDREQKEVAAFQPSLLLNNAAKSENVLNAIVEELEICESFIFSVAFITEGGLAMLKAHLLNLEEKGIRGKILTSTFLQFNSPKLFRELLKVKNVEVKVTDRKGFHSKGYIFKQSTHYSLIVGSSNLTANALKLNYEWNVKLTSHENGDIVNHFSNQFEDVWSDALTLNEEWISQYELLYLANQQQPSSVLFERNSVYNAVSDAANIVPNTMQAEALHQLATLRETGADRGLVISATGTGKTYLSAFDVRAVAPRTMLFVVHREQILKKAMQDYKKVLGGIDSDFGLLTGTTRDINVRYLFATVQTLSKMETLATFANDHFEYILIDEVHRSGAESYQRVMNHFTPKFMLGMTATPERSDDYSVFELFDYNIAYEIRLQQALEAEMLCPFHYYGVSELQIEGQVIEDASTLSQLEVKQRAEHLLEKIVYYGYSGDRVCGLIFCARKDESTMLSQRMNAAGFATRALSGDDSQAVREQAVKELEEGKLDYLLTVDIFNEGVDIPRINQVVMFRQTKSSIVFIQQLGRGLRQHESKEYVTVIDFIGNYNTNFLIPIALSGDNSHNKDNVRRNVKDSSYLKGISSISFEE